MHWKLWSETSGRVNRTVFRSLENDRRSIALTKGWTSTLWWRRRVSKTRSQPSWTLFRWVSDLVRLFESVQITFVHYSPNINNFLKTIVKIILHQIVKIIAIINMSKKPVIAEMTIKLATIVLIITSKTAWTTVKTDHQNHQPAKAKDHRPASSL